MDKYYQDIHIIDNIIFKNITNDTFIYDTHTIKIFTILHDHIYTDSKGNKTYSFYGDFEISSKSPSHFMHLLTFKPNIIKRINSLYINCINLNGKEYIKFLNVCDENLNSFIKHLNIKNDNKGWPGQIGLNYKITVNFNYKEILKHLPMNDDIVGIILKYLII